MPRTEPAGRVRVGFAVGLAVGLASGSRRLGVGFAAV